jgi:transposase InsO family protein
LIAGETGHAHATVWRALRRAGISRPARQPREQARRYEWPCPGDLLHIDTKRFARFSRPGHAVTGDRHTTNAEMRTRLGYEWVHSLVDDHSRLAYSELHRNEQADTVTGFVTRGFAFFARFGITPKRLMSDNAWTYTRNRRLALLLTEHGIRHLLIPSRRPQVNGKVERYQQTLKREAPVRPTAPPTTAPKHRHTRSATTTSADHTAQPAASHPSAASTTSRGRTPSR